MGWDAAPPVVYVTRTPVTDPSRILLIRTGSRSVNAGHALVVPEIEPQFHPGCTIWAARQ